MFLFFFKLFLFFFCFLAPVQYCFQNSYLVSFSDSFFFFFDIVSIAGFWSTTLLFREVYFSGVFIVFFGYFFVFVDYCMYFFFIFCFLFLFFSICFSLFFLFWWFLVKKEQISLYFSLYFLILLFYLIFITDTLTFCCYYFSTKYFFFCACLIFFINLFIKSSSFYSRGTVFVKFRLLCPFFILSLLAFKPTIGLTLSLLTHELVDPATGILCVDVYDNFVFNLHYSSFSSKDVEHICDSIISIVFKDVAVNGSDLFEFKIHLKEMFYDKLNALEINKYIVETVPKLIVPVKVISLPPEDSFVVAYSKYIIDNFFVFLFVGFVFGTLVRFGYAYYSVHYGRTHQAYSQYISQRRGQSTIVEDFSDIFED